MMKQNVLHAITIPFLIFIGLLWGCGQKNVQPALETHLGYSAHTDLETFMSAPFFIVESANHPYNLIGTPVITATESGEETIEVDTSSATIYHETRSWQGLQGAYENSIYRIHFKQVPSTFLGAGKNVGLLVVITYNQRQQPLLITTVHTCGCYLSFTATNHLPVEWRPEDWHVGRNNIYGEQLPGYLDYSNIDADAKLHVLLRHGNHRVMDIWLGAVRPENYRIVSAQIAPLAQLDNLPASGGTTRSFFERQGSRQGYVVGSQKPWERLLMSWWALDWRVGEDKRLGRSEEEGVAFYTSLKPWNRTISDMRNYPRFLAFWGWKL